MQRLIAGRVVPAVRGIEAEPLATVFAAVVSAAAAVLHQTAALAVPALTTLAFDEAVAGARVLATG